MPVGASVGSLDAAIEGSPRSRFLLELFGNSAIFPIANILLELFLEGGAGYFLEPDFYAIVGGALVQSAYLARRDARSRFLGNLAGPAVYTGIETAIEGTRFFAAPHHLAYWGFAAAIGALQEWRARAPQRFARPLLVVESVVRSSILLAMYWIFEASGTPADASPRRFFADPSHRFIAWAVAMLGLLAGIAAAASQHYLALLRAVSRQLRVYSQWLFGRALLEQAVSDPERLALTRRNRAILFMDVRGFTAWSEMQAPETVVAVLNAYYDEAEATFARHAPVRFKFSADEVMALFADTAVALAAARALVAAQPRSLGMHGLGAGIGLHWGPVVEGLMGARELKSYDVIGDTVNTAKRIEGAARSGQILMSDAFRAVARVDAARTFSIDAKGKAERVAVHVVDG